MIEYKRKNFCKFQKMIFEILTKFHHKMMKYKRNQFVQFHTMIFEILT